MAKAAVAWNVAWYAYALYSSIQEMSSSLDSLEGTNKEFGYVARLVQSLMQSAWDDADRFIMRTADALMQIGCVQSKAIRGDPIKSQHDMLDSFNRTDNHHMCSGAFAVISSEVTPSLLEGINDVFEYLGSLITQLEQTVQDHFDMNSDSWLTQPFYKLARTFSASGVRTHLEDGMRRVERFLNLFTPVLSNRQIRCGRVDAHFSNAMNDKSLVDKLFQENEALKLQVPVESTVEPMQAPAGPAECFYIGMIGAHRVPLHSKPYAHRHDIVAPMAGV